jgi:hypothetical protein
MVHISEELRAAKAAKVAIDALSMATPKSAVLATLGKAKNAAILNLSSGGALNEARANVGIALSNVIHGMPMQEKIDQVKRTIEAWIRELEASPALKWHLALLSAVSPFSKNVNLVFKLGICTFSFNGAETATNLPKLFLSERNVLLLAGLQ